MVFAVWGGFRSIYWNYLYNIKKDEEIEERFQDWLAKLKAVTKAR